MALLQLLDEQLKRQVSKSGRTGFQLHILHVDTSTEGITNNSSSSVGNVDVDNINPATALERIKSRYPDYTYTTLPISDAMALPDLTELLQQNNLIPTSTPSDEMPEASTTAPSNSENLTSFLASLPSTTARTDALYIILQKLIVSFAKSLSCEAILYADTTTRLAEKTLSETAKGRGFGLAWAISDGASPFGIDVYYPLRDLLKKELVSYARLSSTSTTSSSEGMAVVDGVGEAALTSTSPSLQDLFVPEGKAGTVVSAKNSSIDELMRGYFEGVESAYPSIVANVVRTTGRLQVPGHVSAGITGTGARGTGSDAEDAARCGFCGLPIISAAGEDGFKIKGVERHGIQFCHGCARSFPLSSA